MSAPVKVTKHIDEDLFTTTDATPVLYFMRGLPAESENIFMRVSAKVFAYNMEDEDDSYAWELEAVFEKRNWITFQIGSTSETLIAGPTPPVCAVSFAAYSDSIRYTFQGEAGKTFQWRMETTFQLFHGLSSGYDYPPRMTIQISSGMGVGETWYGLAEGIHTVLPNLDYWEQHYALSQNERWWCGVYSQSSLFFAASSTDLSTASSRWNFYWTTRSVYSAAATSGAYGAPPTGINGLLRDYFLDKTVVVGSGEDEVTFTWERAAADPSGLWGNY